MNNPSQLERAALLLSERARLARIVSFLCRGGSMNVTFEPEQESVHLNVDVCASKDQKAIIEMLLTYNSNELEALGVKL